MGIDGRVPPSPDRQSGLLQLVTGTPPTMPPERPPPPLPAPPDGFPPSRNGTNTELPFASVTFTTPWTGDGGKPPPSSISDAVAPVTKFTIYARALPSVLHDVAEGTI